MSTSGDAQILNKPTLGDLAAKDKISNADIANDAAIALSKINGNILTYHNEDGVIVYDKYPPVKKSGGGNTTLGDDIRDFVISNDEIKAAIINTILAALSSIDTQTGTAIQKAVIGAALPIGTIVMWEEVGNIPCGWEEVELMKSRFPVGAGQGSELSNYTLGSSGIGGEEAHALTIPEMPSHSHEITQYSAQSGSSEAWILDVVYKTHSQGSTYSTGGNVEKITVPHENRPPYYPVKFIKKKTNCVDSHNLYN
jgi:hypothetical protein